MSAVIGYGQEPTTIAWKCDQCGKEDVHRLDYYDIHRIGPWIISPDDVDGNLSIHRQGMWYPRGEFCSRRCFLAAVADANSPKELA